MTPKVVTVYRDHPKEPKWTGLDPQTLQNRMIESVNFAKELMQTNRELRAEVTTLADRVDVAENENFHLQTENRELRDRIEIHESVIASTNFGDQFDKLDWRELFREEAKAP
jgi:regulator of replication initiation timing